ncbi:MAG TPA: type 4a pilus biogenesis protein PilO [Phycisphaerae bacterium]|nr:type 4a pilus biogenesis protein PilO [Phycisphaerae bacterium]
MAETVAKKAGKGRWIGGAYAAIVGTFGVLIGGALVHGHVVEKSIGATEAQIAQRQQTQVALTGLDQKIKLIKLQVNDYDRLVSPNQDLGEFLKQLNQARDQVGLRDVTISTLALTTRNKSQELPIAIRGTGTFAQFHDFLQRLETLPRMSSVKHLLVEAADPSMSGKVSIELTLSIYSTKSS